MQLENFINKIRSRETDEAIVHSNNIYTYSELGDKIDHWRKKLLSLKIYPGMVIGLKADYSFESISLLLALFINQNIVAVIPEYVRDQTPYIKDGQVQMLVSFTQDGKHSYDTSDVEVDNPLLQSLKKQNHGGFIIYSSGSTGKPKAILHDIEKFLIKFRSASKNFRTVLFLLFDHIAGLDTLFYTLASGGTALVPLDRSPKPICKLIEEMRAEVLSTSPTFLNLVLLSQAFEAYDLSSLKIITYGSEPMSIYTLNRITEIFPNTRIIQKYGTSEFGSPHSKSKGNSELWIKLNSNQYQIKIIDNIIWMKAETTMLGYLNAPNPIDEEGWICTGDEVVEKDGWLKILGRKSDIINIGGEKVYPSEVEAVIGQMDSVIDVVVRGESHPFLGQCICAYINPNENVNRVEMRKSVRNFCREYLEHYKIPTKIIVTDEVLTSSRHKKIRK